MRYRLLTCANADGSGEQTCIASGDDLDALASQVAATGRACVIEADDGASTRILGVFTVTAEVAP